MTRPDTSESAPLAVAYVTDLIFSSRIEATLGREGMTVRTVDDRDAFTSALADQPAVVLLDLHAGADPNDIVALCQKQSVPVLAFGRHTDAALLRSARQAGCAEVVARSTFVEEMPDLVRQVMSLGTRAL